MKVIVAKSAGFCFGVSRAVDLTDELIKNTLKAFREAGYASIAVITRTPEMAVDIADKRSG